MFEQGGTDAKLEKHFPERVFNHYGTCKYIGMTIFFIFICFFLKVLHIIYVFFTCAAAETLQFPHCGVRNKFK